jgi:hypothetical protein
MPEPEPRLSASVIVASEEALRDLLRQPLDFGCKPVVTPLADGRYRITVIGTEALLRGLAAVEREVDIHPLPEVRAEVGDGDRFAGGRLLPRGLARKEAAE